MIEEPLNAIGAGLSVLNEGLKLVNSLRVQPECKEQGAPGLAEEPTPVCTDVEQFDRCQLLCAEPTSDGGMLLASECFASDDAGKVIKAKLVVQHYSAVEASRFRNKISEAAQGVSSTRH